MTGDAPFGTSHFRSYRPVKVSCCRERFVAVPGKARRGFRLSIENGCQYKYGSGNRFDQHVYELLTVLEPWVKTMTGRDVVVLFSVTSDGFKGQDNYNVRFD